MMSKHFRCEIYSMEIANTKVEMGSTAWTRREGLLLTVGGQKPLTIIEKNVACNQLIAII